MERRAEPRHTLQRPATLTLLGDSPYTYDVIVVDLSGQGVRLRLSERLPVSATVRVDLEDMLLLGEVVYCEPQDTNWCCGLRLEHSLAHVSDLKNLCRALVDPDRTKEPAPR